MAVWGQYNIKCLFEKGIGYGLLFMWVFPLAAQDLEKNALDLLFTSGLEAFQTKDYTLAQTHLSQIYAVDPVYNSSGQGSVVYWLGRSYEALGEAKQARQVWWAGLDTLFALGYFDVRTAHAYVQHVFEEDVLEAYEKASNAYIELLNSLDQPISEEEKNLVHDFVLQMTFLIPSAIQEQVWEGNLEKQGISAYKPGAGTVLTTWWRGQDPIPGTLRNERVEEHLVRVAYAEANYGTLEHVRGFDDRGQIYIRLGEPSMKRVVSLANQLKFRKKNFELGTGVFLNTADYPKNEAWQYEGMGQAAYYIFVAQDGYYRISDTVDLVPRTLRNGISPTARGQIRAEVLLTFMEEIYKQLSIFNQDFATRYTAVTNYLGAINATETLTDMQKQTQRYASMFSTNTIEAVDPTGDIQAAVEAFNASPALFVKALIGEVQSEDGFAWVNREDAVPQQHTQVLDDVDLLPIALRTARFLAADGTTRTEIYWAHPPGSLFPEEAPSAEYLVNLTAIQKAENYFPKAIHHHRYKVSGSSNQADLATNTQTFTLEGDAGTYHLGLQWDEYPFYGIRDGKVDLGPRIKMGIEKVDSLTALHHNPRTLEMSDLKPMLVTEAAGSTEIGGLQGMPYAFRAINSAISLALYFEVYHLNYDIEDKTRYTVEYEVLRKEKGGILRFGRDKTDRTSARTLYERATRNTQEHILLDLEDWEGKGTLKVTVRITDETTGEQVERMIEFDFVS